MDGKQEIIETGGSPSSLIERAIDKGADLTKLEKLLELKERYEKNEARKLFASSFAAAQGKIAVVIKTKLNPQTHSKYADLGDIIKSAGPVYTKEGFSVIFYEGATIVPESIRICADVLHTAGHKETYYYDVPLDGKGMQGNANMTKIHGKSSSVSYGRRYLMCMIWNIPVSDDDGNGAGKAVEFITKEQINIILDGVASLELKTDDTKKFMEKFFKFMKVEKIEEIHKTDYQKAMNVFTVEKKKKAGAK